MGDRKNIRIDLQSGMGIKIPQKQISKIVMPQVSVEQHNFRLALDFNRIDQDIRRVKRKVANLF